MNTQMKTSTTTPPPSGRPPNQPNTTEVPQNMKTRSITILATIITALVAFTSASDALAQGETWAATGSLNTARVRHTASLLPNGMVLVAGGFNLSSGGLASAELYDPTTGTWSATGSLATVRYHHTASLLPNGMVLVAGGVDSSWFFNSAELYDPASGTWTATGSLNTGRYLHTATLLPNGMVLVAGGLDGSGWRLNSAELYDPASGTWTATGSLNTARWGHKATLLPNGIVLVAGGSGPGFSILNSAELYAATAPSYSAQVQQPINADGTSVFNVRRGVVPVKFTLTQGGVATCALPPATIAVTRTAGGTTGQIDESVYSGSADTGSNFRIDNCQYVYNLSASALGVGTYRVDININGEVVGSATFQLK